MSDPENHSSSTSNNPVRYTVKVTSCLSGKQTVVIQKEELPVPPTPVTTINVTAPSIRPTVPCALVKDITPVTLKESLLPSSLSDSTPLATPAAFKGSTISPAPRVPIVSPSDSSAPHSSFSKESTRSYSSAQRDSSAGQTSYQRDLMTASVSKDNIAAPTSREGAILNAPVRASSGGRGNTGTAAVEGGKAAGVAAATKDVAIAAILKNVDTTKEPAAEIKGGTQTAACGKGGRAKEKDELIPPMDQTPRASRLGSPDERRLLDTILDSNTHHLKPIEIIRGSRTTRNINVIWGASSVIQLSPSVNSGAGFYPDPDSDSDSDSPRGGKGPIF